MHSMLTFSPMDPVVEYLMCFYSNGHKIYNLQNIRNALFIGIYSKNANLTPLSWLQIVLL